MGSTKSHAYVRVLLFSCNIRSYSDNELSRTFPVALTRSIFSHALLNQRVGQPFAAPATASAAVLEGSLSCLLLDMLSYTVAYLISNELVSTILEAFFQGLPAFSELRLDQLQ